MFRLSVLIGASVLALAVPSAAMAQRDGGGFSFFDYADEEPYEPEQAERDPMLPVKPAVYTPYPQLYIYPVVQAIKPPPPPPPKYKAHSPYPFEDPLLDLVTAREMDSFNGNRDFARYFRRMEEIKDDSDAEWASLDQPILIAAATLQDAEAVEDICADPEACPAEESGDVVVTAHRQSASAMSSVAAISTITNVQSMGVDEGDIVKQIGDHLLVLQDGRIFAVNIKSMQLTDRADVYRRLPKDRKKKYQWESDFEGADWYDEMLVQGDHILITAYSYRDDASEISVFKLDQATGKISNRGVFLISSDDYYDEDNYATRIVGDRLVIYTPYELDQFEEPDERPYLRRWVPQAERKDRQEKGKPLLDPHNIYKPVLRSAEPFVHSISICPLGDFAQTGALDCKSTGFIGPRHAEMFVSTDNVYLWNSTAPELENVNRDDCVADWNWNRPYPALPRASRKDVVPAAVYRLAIRSSAEPTVIGVNGIPFDQFSMDERDGKFRALADWRTMRCEDAERAPAEVAFLSIPEEAFAKEFVAVPDRMITAVPSPGKRQVENRFADNWLVYGGRDGWGSSPPDMSNDEDKARMALGTRLVAVPVKHPRKAQVLNLPHNIIRTERVGNDMMVNGYHDDSGLNMTLVGLGKSAQITSSLFLERRYESEGRSHAFNATVEADGSGLIGVPTVTADWDSGRYVWRSDASDISFVSKASAGTLGNAGALAATPKDKVATHPDYACEVSCIDWYGNSRPIFTGGRIFGLMGTALVEAEMADGRVREKARIDLTVPLAAASFAPKGK
jgi:Beta propeller domain